MSLKSWFKSHGVHITQTTKSYSGGLVDRTVKTPTTPVKSQVRPNGVDRNKLNVAKNEEAVKDSEKFHKLYNARNLKDAAAGLLNPSEWENVLAKEKDHLFPGSTGMHLTALKMHMSWVEVHLTDDFRQTPDERKTPREARVLPGTTMTVLLNAASNACRAPGFSAEDAANAISCLQYIDVLGAIEDPFTSPGAGDLPNPQGALDFQRADGKNFTQQDMANAWRLAIELERSGEAGFNLLKHMMQKTPDANRLHPTVQRQRDALLHTYLQAAREKIEEATRLGEPMVPGLTHNGRLMADPRSIHSHINLGLNGGAVANVEPGVNPALPYRQVTRIGGRTMPNNATLLDKAVKAVSNHLEQVQAHAAGANSTKQITFDRNHGDVREGTNPNLYSILEKDGNWWAANMVRNGIYSEDQNDVEASKLYRTIQRRAEKMVTWLHRANDGGGAPGANRLLKAKRLLKQVFVPNQKSPFAAYNDIAVNSPHRLKAGTDGGGIADGRAIRQQLIWNLEHAIGTAGVDNGAGHARTALRAANYPNNIYLVNPPQPHPQAGGAAVASNPPRQVLEQMVRLAILKQQYRFNGRGGGGDGTNLFITRHNEGDKLEGPDLERAKKAVYEMFDNGYAGQNAATRLLIDNLFRDDAENVQISPETLVRWANDVGAPGGLYAALLAPHVDEEEHKANVAAAIAAYTPAAPPLQPWNQPDWDKFVKGVNRALVGRVEGIRNFGRDLAELNDTDAARLFEEVIKRQELGHLIELKDGDYKGLKTQGISYILTKILTFGQVGVGIDLRLQRGRHAIIQPSTGTGGRDLLLGTAKATKGQAGLGLALGPGHTSKKGDVWMLGFNGGLNVTPFSGEWTDKIGALFRFRRVFSGVDSDDVGNAQLGRLMRKLMNPGNNPLANEGGPWTNPVSPGDQSILKQVMQEFDDVSVGYLKSKDNTFKESFSTLASAGLKLFKWGPSVGIGVGNEWTQASTTWREEGGSLNQERDIKLSEYKVNVNGVLSLLAAAIEELNIPADSELRGLLDAEMWSGVFKMAIHDGLVASADVIRTGTSRRHTWIYNDGALTYTPGICSFYQKTHKNAAAFVASVTKKLDMLAHDKAKVFQTPRYHHPGQAPTDPSEANEQKEELRYVIDQERLKMLEDLWIALSEPEATQEFREYYEWSAKNLQMINDLESLIKSEKAKPDWKSSKVIRDRVKDYERDIKNLKALDDETVMKHGEYRFNIKDNVEFKSKTKGFSLPLYKVRERALRAMRIDNYT